MIRKQKPKRKIKAAIENMLLMLLVSGIYGFTFAYGIIQYCIR